MKTRIENVKTRVFCDFNLVSPNFVDTMKVDFTKALRRFASTFHGHSANQHRFGNIVSASRVVAIVSPESAPIKRIITDARDRGRPAD